MANRLRWQCPSCGQVYAVPSTQGLTVCPKCIPAGKQKARVSTIVRYSMLVTVLAWPAMSFGLAYMLYHITINNRSQYLPMGNSSSGVVDVRTGAFVSNTEVFMHTLVGTGVIALVVTLFCLAVEGMLLFAMKEDK